MTLNTKHTRVWERHWLEGLESPNLQGNRVDSAMCLTPTSLRSSPQITFLMTVIELRKPPVVFNYPFLSKHTGLISWCDVWSRWSQMTVTFIPPTPLPPSPHRRRPPSLLECTKVTLRGSSTCAFAKWLWDFVGFALGKAKISFWHWTLLNHIAWFSYFLLQDNYKSARLCQPLAAKMQGNFK